MIVVNNGEVNWTKEKGKMSRGQDNGPGTEPNGEFSHGIASLFFGVWRGAYVIGLEC